MDCRFHPADTTRFNNVLLLVIDFRKFVFDKVFTIEISNLVTFAFLGIITSQCTRDSMFPTKVLATIVDAISFSMVAIYLDVCSFHTVENMSRGETEAKVSTFGV